MLAFCQFFLVPINNSRQCLKGHNCLLILKPRFINHNHSAFDRITVQDMTSVKVTTI